jgi:uncharacterized membrane protein YkvA (DUF1232 family)
LISRGKPWRCIDDVELATAEWVAWYNQERLHKALGYQSPAECEAALTGASHPASQPTPASQPSRNKTWRDAARLLPDLLRLLKRLAADPTMPKSVRVRLALLVAYLALPFDLIPDFIPLLGYADDAIIVAIALRSVTRRVGPTALSKHWPGTPEGLALRRVSKLPESA